MMFQRWGQEFGNQGGVWGFVVWQPSSPTTTAAYFYDPSQNLQSIENYEVSDGWVLNTGFTQPNGTFARISVIQEILSTPSGQTDITVAGGPQHYTMWEIPPYDYSIWTYANIIDTSTGQVVSTFSHSQDYHQPTNVTDPFWLGDSQTTRRSITQHEEWWDSQGGWSMKYNRTANTAQNTGTIWYMDDSLYGVQYGLLYTWTY